MNATKSLEQYNGEGHYVLIVEDSPVDFEIISRSFLRVEFKPAVYHCTDGDEALEFLMLPHSKKQPSLILLDLNLPGTDGRHVLKSIKSDKNLHHVPVIILSTSNNESDIEFCFEYGADKYLKKPISLDEFANTAKVIKNFWEDQIIRHGSAYSA